MSKVVDKVMDFLGIGATYEDMENWSEELENKEHIRAEEGNQSKKAQILSLHTSKQLRVVVLEPTSFEESEAIASHLKGRRQVIVNFENTDREAAQRIIDFICGACYALEGHVQKVADDVFLFAPSNIDIANETKRQSEQHFPIPWLGQGKDK